MLSRSQVVIVTLACIVFALSIDDAAARNKRKRGPNYYGTYIGDFKTYGHNTSGSVYVINDSTFFIKNFTYDGLAPFAVFWVDSVLEGPSPRGIPVPYPENYEGDIQPLGAYNQSDIILRLPPSIKIRDIKWLSVWCRRFTVNFGEVSIKENLQIPHPRVLPEFSRLAHGLRSDNITILDSRTFYIPNLHYDGAGPDAYFWIGTGPEPDERGMKIPNELNSTMPLKGYEGVDIEIVLPGNLTVYDIDWLAVWCVQYKHNFGYVVIPDDLDVPPALGQTKIATSTTKAPELSNCIELLAGRVQVRWVVIKDDVQIQVSGRIRDDQYVAFGLSGAQGEAEMIEADVVVVGYNKATKQFIAEDYYMSSTSQCDGTNGVCPDHRIGGKNDAVLLHGKRQNGITTVTYMRPLRTNEAQYDKAIEDTESTIIAAIGQFNKNHEANAHYSNDVTNEDIRINFLNQGVHKCVNSLYDQPEIPELEAWPPQRITNETEFKVKIGPTGGQRGYIRITGKEPSVMRNGHPSWGIAFWVNEKLIPEITVERGYNYTFIVETGDDKRNPARYHPFYITDNAEGGFGQLLEHQRKRQKVFAGVDYDENNYPYPTAVGRYCEYVHNRTDQSANSKTFEDFRKTLHLECEDGEPAELVWYVKNDTPDEVYYQCYTHMNLGWKINVIGASAGCSLNSPPIVVFVVALTSILTFSRQR